MQVNLTTKEFRRLLDLVYIGNWVLNSIRGSDRFSDYDQVESKLFGLCRGTPLDELAEVWDGNVVPSRAFNDGGIQEAIVNYEDAVFFDVLAEELARRDMGYPQITRENYDDLVGRMEDYLEEFEAHGTDNIVIEPLTLLNHPEKQRPAPGRALSFYEKPKTTDAWAPCTDRCSV